MVPCSVTAVVIWILLRRNKNFPDEETLVIIVFHVSWFGTRNHVASHDKEVGLKRRIVASHIKTAKDAMVKADLLKKKAREMDIAKKLPCLVQCVDYTQRWLSSTDSP